MVLIEFGCLNSRGYKPVSSNPITQSDLTHCFYYIGKFQPLIDITNLYLSFKCLRMSTLQAVLFRYVRQDCINCC